MQVRGGCSVLFCPDFILSSTLPLFLSSSLQRLNAELHALKKPPYVINLDPAVLDVPFTPNIDIRDTVKYKEVMKQ